MTSYFVDTSVLAYALGDQHPERAAARRVVELAVSGAVVLRASVEMVQELLHHRMRRTDRDAALRQAPAAAELCVLHAFDSAVLSRALELVASSAASDRDAMHAATALIHDLPTILSTDAEFDVIPGLTRLDPAHLP